MPAQVTARPIAVMRFEQWVAEIRDDTGTLLHTVTRWSQAQALTDAYRWIGRNKVFA